MKPAKQGKDLVKVTSMIRLDRPFYKKIRSGVLRQVLKCSRSFLWMPGDHLHVCSLASLKTGAWECDLSSRT